jgi:hypothetical protein
VVETNSEVRPVAATRVTEQPSKRRAAGHGERAERPEGPERLHDEQPTTTSRPQCPTASILQPLFISAS